MEKFEKEIREKLKEMEIQRKDDKNELKKSIKEEIANTMNQEMKGVTEEIRKISEEMRKIRDEVNAGINERFDGVYRYINDKDNSVNIDSPKIFPKDTSGMTENFVKYRTPPLNSELDPFLNQKNHSYSNAYPIRPKLELSKFDGDVKQSVAWINKAEEFFWIHKIYSEEDKIRYAAMQLEGNAYNWYMSWKLITNVQSYSWDRFKNDFFKRFQNINEKDFFAKITRIQQKGDVEEFTYEWEALATRVPELTDDQRLQTYMSGLKPYIRDELELHEVSSLDKARRKAKLIEEKFKRTSQRNNDRGYTNQRAIPPTSSETKYRPPHLREDNKLSIEAKRVREGKCKYCGEKWDPKHRCNTRDNSRKLYACEAEKDEESQIEESDDGLENPQEVLEELNDDSAPRVSIAAIVGISQPQTLKLKGYIKNKKVTVLIDTGSTHNFLDIQMARNLNLFVYPVPDMKVMVADGKKIENVGKCHKVKLNIQDYNLTSEFYTLPLGGVDAVLGVQWLQTLGTYSANHQEHFITFNWQGHKYKLHGFQAPNTQVVSSQQMEKLIRKGAAAYVIQCHHMDGQGSEQEKSNSIEVEELIQKHKKVFEDLPMELPPERRIEHIIEIKPGSSPIKVKPYRYPHHHKTEIERLVQDLLKCGVITKSRSPYSAPVVLVRKKDGSFRLCIDYRGLNNITIKNKFPIPFIDEMLDELHGARYFSKLDLRSGYYQIRVRLEDVAKTAFQTHEGHYEFKVMPFGLTNAPATFQAVMNELFHPHLRKYVLVFFDDILIYSKTWKEHLKHLETVLSILEENEFYAKKSKCTFGKEEVEYLGHIISREGVKVDSKKIQAIKEWPKPKNVSKLRGFLGLAGYYRRFVKNYAHVTAPLTNLLKKNSFQWDEEAEKCFESVKTIMSTTPVLATPDFSKPFVIECDASGFGIGAVLMQEGHPIAFESRKLNKKESLQSTYNKEMLAIIHALTKWRQYLLGSKFVIRTDHNSLQYLLQQKTLSTEQQKWIEKIATFDMEILHKKGKDNVVADALSRRDEEDKVFAISVAVPDWLNDIRSEYVKNPETCSIINNLNQYPKYEWKNDILWYKGRIYLNPNSNFKSKVLQEVHDCPAAGHVGFFKTYYNARQSFFWKGMNADIQKYVAECESCQRNKSENVSTPGLLHPLHIPNQKWEEISMDFIEGLPLSQGKDKILVVVDRLTKYAHFIGVTRTDSAKQTAEVFCKNIYKLHGFPKIIVSDRDAKFKGKFWKEFCKQIGTSLNMSSAYHPQTDGQTEIVNKCLETYLRCFVNDKQNKWLQWLHLAEWWYNSTYHTSAKMTPFQALYGYEPPKWKEFAISQTQVAAVKDQLEENQKVVQLLKDNLTVARNRMKQQADLHRSEREFEVGEWVFVRLQPYKQLSLKQQGKNKLAPKFYGPYQISRKISQVAYGLDLPNHSRIHNVFHVSCLKKVLGNQQKAQTVLPTLDEEGRIVLEPEAIIATRERRLRSRIIKEYLIKWKNLPEEDAAWESEEFLTIHPSLPCFEDKASFKGEAM